MGNRDYTAEILSKKSRLYPRSQRWENVAVHLRLLEEATKLLMFLRRRKEEIEAILDNDDRFSTLDIESARAELEQYIPIRLIACIEGYFRLVYADLIDFGDPYRGNASKFDRVKFSIETAFSLQANSISIGEFIAHLLPLSSLEDINSTMSRLIGDDFLKLFKEKRDDLPVQQALLEFDAFAELIGSVKEIFEVRHIYCHEIALVDTPKFISSGESRIRRVVEFLWISEKLVSELLAENDSQN